MSARRENDISQAMLGVERAPLDIRTQALAFADAFREVWDAGFRAGSEPHAPGAPAPGAGTDDAPPGRSGST